VYVASAANGQPGVKFQGSEYLRCATAAINTTAGSAVLAFLVTDVTQLDQTIVSGADESGAANHFQLKIRDDGTNVGMTMDSEVGGVPTKCYSNETPANATVYIYELSTNGTALTMKVNGVAKTISGTNNGNWFGDSAGIDNLVLGALYDSAGASEYAYVTLLAAALWDTQQAEGVLAAARYYYASKYGATVA
jgi:hypothetical protein